MCGNSSAGAAARRGSAAILGEGSGEVMEEHDRARQMRPEIWSGTWPYTKTIAIQIEDKKSIEKIRRAIGSTNGGNSEVCHSHGQPPTGGECSVRISNV